MHWTDALTQIRAKKLALARIDPHGGMPVSPPRGASASSVALVERRIGRALPPSYRAFLAQHDGFPLLFNAVSLLGANALARGTYVDLARLVLEECETPWRDGAASAPTSRELVPFAIDPSADTVAAWNPAVVTADGELEVVVWVAGIGLRCESFARFLELVLDMVSAELDERAVRLAPRSAPRAAAKARDPEPSARHRSRPPMPSVAGVG